jgi:hypothetical protein
MHDCFGFVSFFKKEIENKKPKNDPPKKDLGP